MKQLSISFLLFMSLSVFCMEQVEPRSNMRLLQDKKDVETQTETQQREYVSKPQFPWFEEKREHFFESKSRSACCCCCILVGVSVLIPVAAFILSEEIESYEKNFY